VDFRDNNNTLPKSEQANKRLDLEINIQHLSAERAKKLISIAHCATLSAFIDACTCGSQWMETLMWKRGYASGTCPTSGLPIKYRTGIENKEGESTSSEWLINTRVMEIKNHWRRRA
jgi:hypothetical protein